MGIQHCCIYEKRKKSSYLLVLANRIWRPFFYTRVGAGSAMWHASFIRVPGVVDVLFRYAVLFFAGVQRLPDPALV